MNDIKEMLVSVVPFDGVQHPKENRQLNVQSEREFHDVFNRTEGSTLKPREGDSRLIGCKS